MDTTEKRGTEETGVNFGRIALQPGSLPLHYGVESGEDADDEGGGRYDTIDLTTTNKGHIGTSHFVLCREIILSSVVKMY